MTISTFILAIALVESGNDPTAVGKHGELSEYQITKRVWEHYAIIPFTRKNARYGPYSYAVAYQHASRLESRIPTSVIIETESDVVKLCAAGWHRGEQYMKRPVSRWSPETRDYAERVWNVYQDLQRKNTLPPAR